MAISDFLFGRPLATSEERAEHIGVSAGIPIFGLDALSSAAYGPEAALTLLIPLGLAGVHIILPISAAIVALLVIVYFSYRQTIEAYPHGGGSYTVASENLGAGAGLLAAAALMIDYVLTAAVGISAGVGALISAVPSLHAHTLPICLGILALLTLINIRGVRDAGAAFKLPTYLFIGSLLIVIAVGLVRAIMGAGHPAPVVAPPRLPAATEAISLWLILKVFASGCTAMTGVEAVSNGVMAFRDPTVKNAQKTLTYIIALLIILLAGIAFLCRAYGIGATDPNSPGYESVLSQLIAAVMGKGVFYFVSIGSILLVLALSANTAFADFPRLTRAIAINDYLPHVFLLRGRRLLYSYGIYALVFLTGSLLVLFGGVTDRLIPLYAIGAFLAFTLSQAGMVVHWKKNQGPKSRGRMIVNGVGAFATGITLLVVLVAKFVEGAWVTALLIPVLIGIMLSVRRHYRRVHDETRASGPIELTDLLEPIVVIPVDRWSRITEKGLRFALTLSKEIRAVHVDCEEDAESVCNMWEANVAGPLRAAKLAVPELVLLTSPYRFVVQPLVDYVLKVEAENDGRHVAVLVPELVVRHWYQNLLHNQRANVLKLALLVHGNQRIMVINIPWYMEHNTDVKVLQKAAEEKEKAKAS
ncbi:Amino acid permease [Acidisarcina polymorpha]|uniref:Amino acid permease n=1 Tax=Acidisarcina polymorpha TaxID=2211140 RepID=A0A2Z5FVZ6_9BACT|nr:APC family permease [Acidisarcina polymorpha]AXC10932.1 Amino acid permease [Acidisarcina polymorpha]